MAKQPIVKLRRELRLDSKFSLKEWLTTTNHKQIGILYIVTAIFFMALAGSFGEIMRQQLQIPNNTLLTAFQYEETVTLHGLLMILWVLSPLAIGIANYIVPLQIGAKDLAFPRVNATSYFTYLFSGVLLVGSVFLPGGTLNTGWTIYAPLNSLQYTPQIGATLAILALLLLSVSVTMGSVNLITTIIKMRTKGITWKRLPIFSWSILFTTILQLFAFPALAAGLVLLSADRFLGTVFFSSMEGGSILWDQLFWFFGHPEVYILVIPALGIIAEVFQTFSRRPLFARNVFLVELAAVTFLSAGVWMHHMFTTGVNYSLLQGFSITTLLISVPFEGLVIGLVLTLYKGVNKINTPMLYCFGAIFTVILGGLTGVLQAYPMLDYAFRGTYWVVGHFHYVMAGTTIFGLLAGLYYWWPKIAKRTYHNRIGIATFVASFIGFNVLYMPYYFLLDMPRRVDTYTASTGWASLNLTATVGALIFGAASFLAVLNLILSLRKKPSAENPWDGREPEWTGNYGGSDEQKESLPTLSTESTKNPLVSIKNSDKSCEWYWCKENTKEEPKIQEEKLTE